MRRIKEAAGVLTENDCLKRKGSLIRWQSDKFLVIAYGTADEMAKAKSILETSGAAQILAHQGVSVT